MYPSITQRTEEYENKIKYYNDTAVYKIRQSQHKQSLVFLKEAEKILEFTIQNNCKIDIAYIMAVLQNSACAYSKLFQLEPVQSYLTLLITNLQNYIQQTTTYPITGKVLYFVASTKQKQNIQNFIIRYFMLVQYYVQYVVVCSQLSQNQSNLNVIKKCLFIIKEICEKIMQLEIVSSGFDIRERCQDGKILEYLIGISDVYEVLEAEEEQRTLGRSTQSNTNTKNNNHKKPQAYHQQKYLQQQHQIFPELSLLKTGTSQTQSPINILHCTNLLSLINEPPSTITQIKSIKIQTIAQKIHPISSSSTLLSSQRSVNNRIGVMSGSGSGGGVSGEIKLELVLYCSVCYFLMATESRLLAAMRYQENRRQSALYRVSRRLHLKSIQIYIKYIPIWGKYIQSLVNSYQKHYQTQPFNPNEYLRKKHTQNPNMLNQHLLKSTQSYKNSKDIRNSSGNNNGSSKEGLSKEISYIPVDSLDIASKVNEGSGRVGKKEVVVPLLPRVSQKLEHPELEKELNNQHEHDHEQENERQKQLQNLRDNISDIMNNNQSNILSNIKVSPVRNHSSLHNLNPSPKIHNSSSHQRSYPNPNLNLNHQNQHNNNNNRGGIDELKHVHSKLSLSQLDLQQLSGRQLDAQEIRRRLYNTGKDKEKEEKVREKDNKLFRNQMINVNNSYEKDIDKLLQSDNNQNQPQNTRQVRNSNSNKNIQNPSISPVKIKYNTIKQIQNHQHTFQEQQIQNQIDEEQQQARQRQKLMQKYWKDNLLMENSMKKNIKVIGGSGLNQDNKLSQIIQNFESLHNNKEKQKQYFGDRKDIPGNKNKQKGQKNNDKQKDSQKLLRLKNKKKKLKESKEKLSKNQKIQSKKVLSQKLIIKSKNKNLREFVPKPKISSIEKLKYSIYGIGPIENQSQKKISLNMNQDQKKKKTKRKTQELDKKCKTSRTIQNQHSLDRKKTTSKQKKSKSKSKTKSKSKSKYSRNLSSSADQFRFGGQKLKTQNKNKNKQKDKDKDKQFGNHINTQTQKQYLLVNKNKKIEELIKKYSQSFSYLNKPSYISPNHHQKSNTNLKQQNPLLSRTSKQLIIQPKQYLTQSPPKFPTNPNLPQTLNPSITILPKRTKKYSYITNQRHISRSAKKQKKKRFSIQSISSQKNKNNRISLNSKIRNGNNSPSPSPHPHINSQTNINNLNININKIKSKKKKVKILKDK